MVTADLTGILLLTNKEQRLRELEELFADWADSVEDNLMNYNKRVSDMSDNALASDLELYRGQLREIRVFDIEHKMLSSSSISNPDYVRAVERLKNISYLAETELNRRYPRVY